MTCCDNILRVCAVRRELQPGNRRRAGDCGRTAICAHAEVASVRCVFLPVLRCCAWLPTRCPCTSACWCVLMWLRKHAAWCLWWLSWSPRTELGLFVVICCAVMCPHSVARACAYMMGAESFFQTSASPARCCFETPGRA